MSSSEVGERLAVLLAPAAAQAGLVIDGVRIATAGRRRLLRIDVDLPESAVGSVDLDTVAAASRAISEFLDSSAATADVIGAGPYSLEVGTAGVDRPLRERRHWMRARSRLVLVTTATGGTVTGRLVAVDDAGIQLDVDGTGRRLPWADIATGVVQVEFRRPKELDGAAEAADDEDNEDVEDDEDNEDENEVSRGH